MRRRAEHGQEFREWDRDLAMFRLASIGGDGMIDVGTVKDLQGSERHVVLCPWIAYNKAERLATANAERLATAKLSSEEDVDQKFDVTITR
jgi:hypothetical protein